MISSGQNTTWWRLTGLGFLVSLVLVLCVPVRGWSGEVTVAAASDLNYVFKDLIGTFEKQTGHKVRLTLGSSGNFYAQITNGAPFDVYFSADVAYPKKLEEAGLTVPGSLFPYAVGRLVVWVPSTSPLVGLTRAEEVVAHPSVARIAIANPKHAPYGRAAVAALQSFQLYDKVKDKLVLGENVSQAAQFVQTGNADVGVIALSLALAPTVSRLGMFWEVPQASHPPLEQGAVLLNRAKDSEAAQAFVAFIKGAEARAVMKRFGFLLPGEVPAP
jgi:molybdate transport system substrate-binding protein